MTSLRPYVTPAASVRLGRTREKENERETAITHDLLLYATCAYSYIYNT